MFRYTNTTCTWVEKPKLFNFFPISSFYSLTLFAYCLQCYQPSTKDFDTICPTVEQTLSKQGPSSFPIIYDYFLHKLFFLCIYLMHISPSYILSRKCTPVLTLVHFRLFLIIFYKRLQVCNGWADKYCCQRTLQPLSCMPEGLGDRFVLGSAWIQFRWGFCVVVCHNCSICMAAASACPSEQRTMMSNPVIMVSSRSYSRGACDMYPLSTEQYCKLVGREDGRVPEIRKSSR